MGFSAVPANFLVKGVMSGNIASISGTHPSVRFVAHIPGTTWYLGS